MALEPIPIPMLDNPVSDTGRFSRPWTQYLDKLNTAVATAAAGMGVTNGSDATAGQVGEYLTASAGPISIASTTTINLATLALGPGDWEVDGNIKYQVAGNTIPLTLYASVSNVSATFDAVRTEINGSAIIINSGLATTFGTGFAQQCGCGGARRFSSASASTAYLVARIAYVLAASLANGGSATAQGTIWARRVR